MNVYWSKVAINALMLMAVTAVIVFGIRAGMRAEQLAAIVVPLFAAAQQLLPAVEKKKTGLTIYPEAYPKGLSIPPSPTLAKLMAELQSQSIPPVAIDKDGKK